MTFVSRPHRSRRYLLRHLRRPAAEVGASLLAVGPEHPEAGILYGRQIACGSIGQLYNSLRRILSRRPPRRRPDADLLFGSCETVHASGR